MSLHSGVVFASLLSLSMLAAPGLLEADEPVSLGIQADIQRLHHQITERSEQWPAILEEGSSSATEEYELGYLRRLVDHHRDGARQLPPATARPLLRELTLLDRRLDHLRLLLEERVDASGSRVDVGVGGEISGTVTDAVTGEPLAGVYAEVWNSNGVFAASGTTDASGRYVTSDRLPPGTYYVTTDNSRGYLDALYGGASCVKGGAVGCDPTAGRPILVTRGASAHGVDFALAGGGSIAGRVTDASTGTGRGSVRIQIWDAQGDHVGSATSDGSGAYLVTGLAPGNYFVSTDTSPFLDELYGGFPCAGGAPAGCDVTTGTSISVTTGATTSGINFSLEGLGSISGTVTDFAGSPLPGIEVSIFDASGIYQDQGFTDSSGDYIVGGLADGSYFATARSLPLLGELYDDLPCPLTACTVTDGTLIPVTVDVTTSGIDFELDYLGEVIGTVTDVMTGTPVANVQVAIWPESGVFASYGTTNAAGEYVVSRLEAGTYFAVTNSSSINNELYDDLPCPKGAPADCTVSTGTPIAVSLNATISGIDFAVTHRGAITGTVTDQDTGLPVTTGSVRVWDDAGFFVRGVGMDANGVWEAERLVDGTYFASTTVEFWTEYFDELYDDILCPGGVSSGCDATTGTPITVSAGVVTSGIDFALRTGGVIAGTVTEAGTGTPITDGEVWVYNAGGAVLTFEPLDASGGYRIPELLAGSYFVRARVFTDHVGEVYENVPCGFSCVPTAGTPVPVTLGSTTMIDFALDRGGAISGTVTDAATGLPITTGHVTILDAVGAFAGVDSLNSSGFYIVSGLVPGNHYAMTVAMSADHRDELYEDLGCLPECPVTLGKPIAVALDTTTTGVDFALEAPTILIDGFESGDFSAWSGVIGGPR